MFHSKMKVWIIFFGGSLLLSVILFLFPINIFDGEIIVENGIQKIVLERPLSLSYFIGLGYDQDDMVGITDFYLTTKGKVMAFLFIFGFPALLAYRSYLQYK